LDQELRDAPSAFRQFLAIDLSTYIGDVAGCRRVMAVRLSSILEGFRAALRRERLPEPSPNGPSHEGPPGVLRLIFARETLPLEPVAVAPPHRGILSLLFAIEPLEQGAPAPAPRRAPWLNWLFRPEKLDD
jgi:hypothetical protein